MDRPLIAIVLRRTEPTVVGIEPTDPIKDLCRPTAGDNYTHICDLLVDREGGGSL